MKYNIVNQSEDTISLEVFKKIIEESDISQVRNKCLFKRDDRIFRLVIDCKDYSYKLLNLKDFSLLSEESFDDGFNGTIERLLTNGYEVIYED